MGSSVEGTAALRRDLARIPRQVAEAAQTAVMAAADAVADDARTQAPVLTGALRDSITVQTDEPDVVVDARADYAGYVEFGTSDAPAQPFLGPAVETERTKLLNRIIVSVRRRL